MMTIAKKLALALVGLFTCVTAVLAQEQDSALVFATVERAPFSMDKDGDHTGFSIELMRALAQNQGWDVTFQRVETFPQMLDLVNSGAVDGAVANISITAAREEAMDFPQPIFEAGLKIMVPFEDQGGTIFDALFTLDILYAILLAFGLLFGGGMLMWFFEKGRQPYFDREAKDAMFPSFWWALNLVVNGGFEERMPQSVPGRFFAVFLVISSLFIVSIFVAQITTAMTVNAISGSVNSINDLEGRVVASTQGSTGSAFLSAREISHKKFENLEEMLDQFERGKLDAVVFDGPILAYYVQTKGAGVGRLIQRNFKPENYGIALPAGSQLVEPINRGLLELRETGTYDLIRQKWFGSRN